MPPLIYEPGLDNPKRLTADVRPRGYTAGLSAPGGLLFGGIFAGIGVFITLFGLRIVEPGGRLNAPHWVLIPIGAVFTGCGLFIWSKIWRQHRADRRHAQIRLRHPDEPALADHPWDPHGQRSLLHAHAVRATIMVVFFILFLTPCNYIAFASKDAHWLMMGIIGLFDLVSLYLVYDMALRWGRFCKFGRAFLRFERFPFSTREPVALAWIAPEGCTGEATGRFTLRSVREWYEAGGRGKSRNTRLVREQQWSGSWTSSAPARIVPGQVFELVFDLPSDAPSTALHAERPFFWELEIVLALPGLDFTETYLVPIYGPKRT